MHSAVGISGLQAGEDVKHLQRRISLFVSLPLMKLDKLTLQKRLEEIGKS